MNWPLFFAFLSPIIFAFMNVIDTYIVKKRVKHVFGFAVVSGITNILFGIILALFLNWNSYSLLDFRFSILAGSMFGIQLYFYYFILAKHDVSHAVGLIYVYPIIVAFLSYLFLNEKLSILGYSGVFITLCGIILMSIRLKKLKMSIAFWSLGISILTIAFSEFFIKVATNQLPQWHGTAINSMVMGIFILPALLNKSIRKGFKKEFKNIRFTFISEALTLGAIVTLYLAMSGLSATIVSVISATQPLFVLIFESAAFYAGIKISRDLQWKNKAIAIILVVIGIVILYLNAL